MIDKYEKGIFITSALVMMLFIFSLIYSLDKKSRNITECLPFNKSYRNGRVVKIDDKTYQVYMVAKMWAFDPEKIYIPVGSDVDFYLTSNDVVHGFNIAEKNINLMAVYGGVGKTTVHFDKPGVYNIVCHEYCGVGHQFMHGEVIVNYPESK
jgi:cytochrome c oxidase subunit 2